MVGGVPPIREKKGTKKMYNIVDTQETTMLHCDSDARCRVAEVNRFLLRLELFVILSPLRCCSV
jgi:hypothetical protein